MKFSPSVHPEAENDTEEYANRTLSVDPSVFYRFICRRQSVSRYMGNHRINVNPLDGTCPQPAKPEKAPKRPALEKYRETYLIPPKIKGPKAVFISEETRSALDMIVLRLGCRGMSVSGLLENLARRHLETYRQDIERWRKL